MEPSGPLSHTQPTATRLHPEPDQSSPSLHSHFLKKNCNIILPLEFHSKRNCKIIVLITETKFRD